jgi:hypothetical protein
LSEDVHENASQALCDIIAVSMNNPASPLMSQLESEEIIKPLMMAILTEGADSSLVHGLAVIIQLLRRHAQPVYDKTTSVEQLSPFLKVIVSHMEPLHVPISPSFKSVSASSLRTRGTIFVSFFAFVFFFFHPPPFFTERARPAHLNLWHHRAPWTPSPPNRRILFCHVPHELQMHRRHPHEDGRSQLLLGKARKEKKEKKKKKKKSLPCEHF